MKRGDIYYISIPFNTGSEINKTRPGVIVSNDEQNASGSVVTVVFLSASCKRLVPSHVAIQSSHRLSMALCEQIFTIDKSRIGDYVGNVTEKEMQEIEEAIRYSLALPEYKPADSVPVGADQAKKRRMTLRSAPSLSFS